MTESSNAQKAAEYAALAEHGWEKNMIPEGVSAHAAIAQVYATLALADAAQAQSGPQLDVEWGVFYENEYADSNDVEIFGFGPGSESLARAEVSRSPSDRGLRSRLVSQWEEH